MEYRADVEYRVAVDGHMKVLKVEGENAHFIDPLSPGEYRFVCIRSPIGTEGYWLVLNREYGAGICIGRDVRSTTNARAVEEGFVIEEITVRKRGSNRQKQPA